MHPHLLRGLTTVTLMLLSGMGTITVLPKPSYADVIIKYEKSFVIDIFNAISKADAKSIAQRAAELEYAQGVYVRLNSLGGDVDSAIQIGRIIRKNEGHTSIASSAKCHSSCALIYIAGVVRSNLGAIELHSPTLASAPQTPEGEASPVLQKIKSYIQEMGSSDRFYQEMVDTELSSMKVYVGGDIGELVPDIDQKHDEAAISYRARAYGIDKAEMKRRERDGEQCTRRYSATQQFVICLEASNWGLSPAVYSQREIAKRAQCKLSYEEENKLKLAKRREVVNHPLYLKREACVRRIMLGR